MKVKNLAIIGLIAISLSCQNNEKMDSKNIDVQGHRGTRGLMPENTIPAFIKAVELGVTTLELDLAVTKDGELLVSHEPYIGSHLGLDSLGNEFSKEEEHKHNIYQMSYLQIKKYDVGTKFLTRFPDQKKMKVHKPLLSELVEAVNAYVKTNNLSPVRYNIEIKSDAEGDNLFHPPPAQYSKLVYDFINQKMDKNLLNVQSFDFRILQYFHNKYPEIKLAVLIENEFSIDENIETLGFTPEIYSCDFKLLDAEKVSYLKSRNMKVIPWTVNEPSDIKKMVEWETDGIISDYPNRVLDIISH